MAKIEFPRWIFKGKSETKIVQNFEEYQTALLDGWRKDVLDFSEIDDSEKLDKIGNDVKFIRKEVKKISQGVDALQGNVEAPKLCDEPEATEATEEPEEPEEPEELLSYRAMLEAKAKKLKIKFGINTSNSQLAAMIQRRG